MSVDPLDDDDFEDDSEFDDNAETSDVSDDDPDTDNVGDPSVEINVEELIQELEGDGLEHDCNREHVAKRRLEEIMEAKRAKRELEDFEDYEF